jgi:WD40 repeat protein
VWDTASGKKVYALGEGLDFYHFPVCFSSDGRLMAAVSIAKLCRLLDTKTGKIRDLAKLSELATALAFSREGKRLALSLNDRTLVCLNTATGKQLWRIQSERSQCLTFAAGDHVLALARLEGDGGFILLDAETGRPLGRDRLLPAEGRCWDCSAAGDTLALLLSERKLVWDLKAAKERTSLKEMSPTNGICQRVALTPDGKSVFTLGPLLERWDAATGVREFADTRSLGHTNSIVAVAYSPDGQHVATVSRDQRAAIRIWDANSSRLLLTLPDHGDSPLAFLRFTPDGKHLLAAGMDSTVRIWDVAAGKEVRHWDLRDSEGKEIRYLTGLRLADDGKTLVTLVLDPHNGALNGRGDRFRLGRYHGQTAVSSPPCQAAVQCRHQPGRPAVGPRRRRHLRADGGDESLDIPARRPGKSLRQARLLARRNAGRCGVAQAHGAKPAR